MLKYKIIVLVSILLLIITLIADCYFSVSIWLYVGIVLASAGLLGYGSISIRSDFYSRVLCSADTGEKVIALTFDDGPDQTVTPRVLDILKEQQVQATFFCIGHKVEENPGLIKRMDQEGHAIGSHSYSHHFFFDLFRFAKMLNELKRTENILERVLDKKIKMFRPPYGVTNPPLARALRKMNYHIIGWSLWSKDTVIKDEDLLFERLKIKLGTGDILVFHDTRSHMVAVLDKFIKFAKENKYRFVRVDNLLHIEAYE
jgi:peptidoglycan/xylan/chitin deacetylase (PgdA/CDA1 family)